MNPFEQLARRNDIWLFLFALALAIAGLGLALTASGLITGWAWPAKAGLVIAMPGAAGAAMLVGFARLFPRTSERASETNGQLARFLGITEGENDRSV